MEKIPYTNNTENLRTKIETFGYSPLRFFQGGKFIKPIISTRANSKLVWKEYTYSTFNDIEEYDFELFYLTEEEFLQEIINLKNNGKTFCNI